jgi:hypothetical protein
MVFYYETECAILIHDYSIGYDYVLRRTLMNGLLAIKLRHGCMPLLANAFTFNHLH